MAGVQKISANMRAISEADYRVLFAAASESFNHWQQSQEYLQELTALKAASPAAKEKTAEALADAQQAVRALLALVIVMTLCGIGAVIWAVGK